MSSNSNTEEDINDNDEGWHTLAPRRNRVTVTPDTTPVRNSFQALLRDAATLFNDDYDDDDDDDESAASDKQKHRSPLFTKVYLIPTTTMNTKFQ